MSKLDEFMEGRTAGLLLAYKIVCEGGIEALEKEIKFRNRTKINTNMDMKNLDKASQKIKEHTIDSLTVINVSVLHDEFGFGQKRVSRYLKKFMSIAEALIGDYASMQDYVDMVHEELGIDLKIRSND